MMAKVGEGSAKKTKKKPTFKKVSQRPETLEAFAKAVGERMGKGWVTDQIFRYKQRKDRQING